jgi:SAM-dependent methyltransferase
MPEAYWQAHHPDLVRSDQFVGTPTNSDKMRYARVVSDDPRLDYPATRRNRDALLTVLQRVLPGSADGSSKLVLEIASGSGQHVAHFAAAMTHLRWQPSDIDSAVFASIAAWTGELDNVASPIAIDVTESRWPIERCDAVVCANMIHIAPWSACLGLLDGVARILVEDGLLCLYGPFKRGGVHTAQSNEAFDESLRSRNPSWGVRDLDVVADEANRRGLALADVFEMPANNLSAVFRRAPVHRA